MFNRLYINLFRESQRESVNPIPVFPLSMTSFLLFVLLVLLHTGNQIQAVQAQGPFSVALPLAVRSPYLNCWLPRVNGSDNAAGISPTRAYLPQVGPFLQFDIISIFFCPL